MRGARRIGVLHGADHGFPRGCGEHDDTGMTSYRDQGSSPRMRGALGDVAQELFRTGIIPADAGSTWSGSSRWSAGWDHPRGCGEHRRYVDVDYPIRGSSPRMRGAHFGSFQHCQGFRIIPADAGSTWLFDQAWPITEDHPRGCGEHSRRSSHERPEAGSSPRMRGAHRVGLLREGGRGIIPADAGSTR